MPSARQRRAAAAPMLPVPIHQQRLSSDRRRVQRLPACVRLVGDDGGEAVVEHQHRHESVLARPVRVRVAVVDDGDALGHPVHGAQVLHTGADDVWMRRGFGAASARSPVGRSQVTTTSAARIKRSKWSRS